jgi:LytS/YehU family sensor histidine kinase
MTSQEEFLVRITQPLKVFLDALMFGSLASFVYVNVSTSRQAAARMRSAEIARGETSRRTFESQLQAMQARVEPQFLFNTLAQVKQLFDTDARLAGRMLDDLIAYLRAALPHLRETSSTLGKEIELARAYLNIMQVRLGERLAFDFDVPDAVKDARMPPMMLLPLIDHALVYGFEKAHSGGTLHIATRASDGRLRLSIADDGAGFVPGGHASDLKDIEARLVALYGDEAGLELERIQSAGADRGTRATLEIPYETTDGDHR